MSKQTRSRTSKVSGSDLRHTLCSHTRTRLFGLSFVAQPVEKKGFFSNSILGQALKGSATESVRAIHSQAVLGRCGDYHHCMLLHLSPMPLSP